MNRYWVCRCGRRNDRVKQKCANELCRRTRPKRRVRPHMRALELTYEQYVQVSSDIHGVTDESCCLCGKPRGEGNKHHRDHDHRTGQPRGLACFRCNTELLRHHTLDSARLTVAYLERVQAYYETLEAA